MTSTPASPDLFDPRYGFAVVTQAVGALIAATPDTALGDPTPCDEFTVKDLIEHILMVMGRVGALGRGEHWSTIDTVAQDSGWHDSYGEAAHAAMEAWTDADKLEAMYEVPWGEMPGGPMMFTYTAEMATHGWDLATATGQDFEIPDEALEGALVSIKFVPAEGRDGTNPEMPFGPVVDPGPDAPLLLQIAGWGGRPVA